MPFSPCKHHITFVSGQVVSSVLVASLPDTPGRVRQQAEASRTVGRCDRKVFWATGCMVGKDAIDKRQGRSDLGQGHPEQAGCARAFGRQKGFFLISWKNYILFFTVPKGRT